MIEEEEKAEKERIRLAEIERLNSVRRELAMPYYFFWSEHEKQINFGEQSEDEFSAFLERIKKAKADDDLQQEEIRKENERLADEKRKAEEKAKKEREEVERQLEQQRKEQEEVLRKEREKQAELEAQLEAKRKAELEAENKRIKEEQEKKKEAERLAKAPIKNQLNTWVNSFEIPETNVDNDVSKLIKEKFNAFKDWSLTQVGKCTGNEDK
jgi:flagellar biosynthesis GTPase FlhF